MEYAEHANKTGCAMVDCTLDTNSLVGRLIEREACDVGPTTKHTDNNNSNDRKPQLTHDQGMREN